MYQTELRQRDARAAHYIFLCQSRRERRKTWLLYTATFVLFVGLKWAIVLGVAP